MKPEDEDRAAGGVVVDISRKRVLIDGESAAFTFKEFELLQYLVLREGRTIERTELVNSLWQGATDDEAPGERTIDVHVRRLARSSAAMRTSFAPCAARLPLRPSRGRVIRTATARLRPTASDRIDVRDAAIPASVDSVGS